MNVCNLRSLDHYVNAVWSKGCAMTKAVSPRPGTTEGRITP